MISNIFLDVLEISIFTSVLIVIVMLSSKVISKRYQVGWRKAVWFIIAIRMLIPFNISPSVTLVYQIFESEMTSEDAVNSSDIDTSEVTSSEEDKE